MRRRKSNTFSYIFLFIVIVVMSGIVNGCNAITDWFEEKEQTKEDLQLIKEFKEKDKELVLKYSEFYKNMQMNFGDSLPKETIEDNGSSIFHEFEFNNDITLSIQVLDYKNDSFYGEMQMFDQYIYSYNLFVTDAETYPLNSEKIKSIIIYIHKSFGLDVALEKLEEISNNSEMPLNTDGLQGEYLSYSYEFEPKLYKTLGGGSLNNTYYWTLHIWDDGESQADSELQKIADAIERQQGKSEN